MQICIFSGFVAGVQYHNPDFTALRVDEPVEIRLDRKNAFDPNAIELHQNGQFLGFIPRVATYPVHNAISQGLQPTAVLAALDPQSKKRESILVRIYVTV